VAGGPAQAADTAAFRLGKSATVDIAWVVLAYKFDYGPVVAKY
jgi:hypothetical protein